MDQREVIAGHLEKARELKDEGNRQLKDGKYKQASFEYKKALMFVTEYLPKGLKASGAPELAMFGGGKVKANEEEGAKAVEMCVQLNGNIAQARLKLQDWDGAIKHATEVIRLDPQNTKAHFRRGTAYLNRGDTERARADLDIVQAREPDTVKHLLVQLEKEEAKQKKAQDKLYKRMFG